MMDCVHSTGMEEFDVALASMYSEGNSIALDVEANAALDA